MPNLFKTRRTARKLVTLTLAAGAFALPSVKSAAARDIDPRRYEAIAGRTAPQMSGPAPTCDGGVAFGAGDEHCSMTGGPSGGLSDRN